MCILRRNYGLLLALTAAVTAMAAEPGGKRIVILGSSTAAGAGASTYARSWAGRLTEVLAPRGCSVINVSVSGHATRDAILRFASVVTPLKPDFVVLATSISNEGLARSTAAGEVYRTNLLQLVGMVRAIGAVPVVIGQYPNSAYGDPQRRVIADLYRWLDDVALPTWDFWNAVVASGGGWVDGLSTDGTHPLDRGHALMFDAIPLGFFDVGRKVRDTSPAAWRFRGGRGGETAPLAVDLDRAAGSWTQAAWIANTSGADRILLANDSGFNLLQHGGSLRVYSPLGHAVIAAEVWPGSPFRHVCLSFRESLGEISLAVDGTVVGIAGGIAAAPARSFRFAGLPERPDLDCIDCAVALPSVHRSALGVGDVAAMAMGQTPWKSLDVVLRLDQLPPAGPVNAAETAIAAVVSGWWEPSTGVCGVVRGVAGCPDLEPLLPARAGRPVD